MLDYDVIVIGGGIAGSCCAKDLATAGMKVLLIEKEKVPRNKPCSGIQWPYFEKIIGEKIPKNRLCNYQIEKVHAELPDGFTSHSKMKMLNFMRKPFDQWLNLVAQKNGVLFWDETKYVDFVEKVTHIKVELIRKGNQRHKITTKYLIDATGLRPVVRKKLRPEDFSTKSTGATLNYYVEGTAELEPDTLYQIWNLEFCDTMFAWVYTKTLDDGKDYWVVGTGGNTGSVKERHAKFYKYIQDKYNLKGEIVKKEGYSQTLELQSDEKVWLGANQYILMVGDAAGLIDPARGVGMDSAAISGRLAAKAIIQAEKEGKNALEIYKKLMKFITKQTIINQNKDISRFETNEEMTRHLKIAFLKMGIKLVWQQFANKFRKLEKTYLLPPS